MQWVDCVSQLLRMYPFAFEFSSVRFILHYICLYETAQFFLLNVEDVALLLIVMFAV